MMQQKKQSKDYSQINLLQPNHYGCFAKIFCCKCIHCCKDFDFSLLTSQNRKKSFQNLITKYIKKLHENKNLSVIMDPFFILVALFLGQQSEIYTQLMSVINNQSQYAVFSKEDLQFYIPQLCTYLVFHQQLENIQLQKLLVKACKVDIHFSLKYYFYMTSLQAMNIGDFEIRKYQKVSKYNLQFKNMINHYYQNHRNEHQAIGIINASKMQHQEQGQYQNSFLRNTSFVAQKDKEPDDLRSTYPNVSKSQVVYRRSAQVQHRMQSQQKMLGSKENKNVNNTKQNIKMNKIRYLRQTNIYQSFISKKVEISKGIFESTINFFSDLVQLSRLLLASQNRNNELKKYINQINQRLPATIYIPFTKDCYQDLNIISIIGNEARVFNTKERAPYYICLESFQNPTYNDGISKDKKIKSFASHKKNRGKRGSLEEKPSQTKIQEIKQIHESQIHFKLQKQKQDQMRSSTISNEKSQNSKKGFNIKWNSFFKLSKKIKKKIFRQTQQQGKDSSSEGQSDNKTELSKNEEKQHNLVQKNSQIQNIFGISQAEQYENMILLSPYTNLPGYKLIHIIIKSNDDLRQQSFAMQLLQEFQKIFMIQKLPAIVIPYEVLPLSHEAGIMECIREALTIDQLLKKGISLSDVLNTKVKKKNFVYSLAGYSLATYFLQVKDRHNGNIMIRRDGCIFHIDYGFFMSNAPGKGVQLQKNLPFKLTNEYVQALGGLNSKYFQLFRKIFYQGFNACCKHQHRILILTKLMYTSFGKTMPCFMKGDQAIDNLQQRFNPLGMKSDADISVFCQSLINSSIDNWRSRWYDKWQYYVQGIFY